MSTHVTSVVGGTPKESIAQVSVSIPQEQLAEQMVKAVLDRGLNSTLERSINAAFDSYKVNTLVENTIHAMMQSEIRDFLMKDVNFKERVQKIVIEKVTDDYLDKVITKIIENIHSRW